LGFFLFFALGPDYQKVKYSDYRNEGKKSHNTAAGRRAAIGTLRRGSHEQVKIE
jgi:hypothetical protein